APILASVSRLSLGAVRRSGAIQLVGECASAVLVNAVYATLIALSMGLHTMGVSQMSDTVGLIERAAALLRQQDPAEPVTPLKPNGGPVLTSAGPELVLDRGRLAGFGIAIPSAARSRTVEEFRLIKRNLIAA